MTQKAEHTPVEKIICPACGAENAADAVFCFHADCHKALGEFDFADERVRSNTSWAERIADRIANFVGQFHFITAHIIWFVLWIILNSGVLASLMAFDDYPYSLLGIILSIGATLITSVLLISNNRQNEYANMRAQMDYEVNVRTYRRIRELEKKIDALRERQEEG